MDADQHGQVIPRLCAFGNKYVQKQAILAVVIGLALAKLIIIEVFLFIFFLVVKRAGLIAAAAILRCIIDPLPGRDLLGDYMDWENR